LNGKGEAMEPKNEPLEPTVEQAPERRTSGEEVLGEEEREESGLAPPESSAQKPPQPGPKP
jgi:hypothetical protein